LKGRGIRVIMFRLEKRGALTVEDYFEKVVTIILIVLYFVKWGE
jgi:hypothetical protein